MPRDPHHAGIIFPLHDFWELMGQPPPHLELVTGEEVPPPYHDLLVHRRDMTPTLEAWHGDRLHLELLNRERRDQVYAREVLLRRNRDGAPVEYGVIQIYLDRFPALAVPRIVEAKTPLGAIFREFDIPHRSEPWGFLCVTPNQLLRALFELDGKPALYGRLNTLYGLQAQPLAEVLEILPPTATRGISAPPPALG